MKVAGFGLRSNATLASLQGALRGETVDAFAAPADKADHPALAALCRATGLPLHAVALAALANQPAQTPSPRQPARYGTNSVAEAAALACAGPGARLRVTRIASPDRRATLAIAEGPTP